MATEEQHLYKVGERVEKFCTVCEEERGHVVATVTKRGQISRVDCPKCGTRSTFKSKSRVSGGARAAAQAGAPYDRTRTYRPGQTILHPVYGIGVITCADVFKANTLSLSLAVMCYGRAQGFRSDSVGG